MVDVSGLAYQIVRVDRVPDGWDVGVQLADGQRVALHFANEPDQDAIAAVVERLIVAPALAVEVECEDGYVA